LAELAIGFLLLVVSHSDISLDNFTNWSYLPLAVSTANLQLVDFVLERLNREEGFLQSTPQTHYKLKGSVILQEMMECAAKNGHISMIKWTIGIAKFHFDRYWWKHRTSICAAAAKSGKLEVLQWLHVEGFAWSATTCAAAASTGNLQMLKFARDHGCAWDTATFCNAASNGSVAILNYAHENQCPWSDLVCTSAIRSSQLEVRKKSTKREKF
jgi:hypothetical protein